MAWTFNPFTNKFDKTFSETEGSAIWLKIDASNDPLTGKLTITPASGTTALEANQDIVILAGKKLILDGA